MWVKHRCYNGMANGEVLDAYLSIRGALLKVEKLRSDKGYREQREVLYTTGDCPIGTAFPDILLEIPPLIFSACVS